MDKKTKIKKLIIDNHIERLSDYNQSSLSAFLVDIFKQELEEFSYSSDIDYLDSLIKILPKYMEKSSNIKYVDENLKLIHQKIKEYLVQKPGNIEKNNHNYKLLKNLINNVELIQMSLLYNFSNKYEGSKYKLINYITFDLKNISIFKDALNKFPYLVNYFDENDKNIIVSVCDKYIEEVLHYTKEKGIDNIIYYDEVIDCILKSQKFIFDIVDKQTILKKIRNCFGEIKNDKNRKIFYLNTLVDKLNNKEEILSNSYLEYKYNIASTFNEAIKSEVRKIIDNYSISKSRKIIDDYILTFDGEGANEIDDALSVKILDNDNILLGVHIADPTDAIDRDSIILDEAAKRTTSIYLSNETYSMFPKELSKDLLSLKEGNYRPAITYYFEFDKKGKLVDYKFIKSIIKVNRNMTYDDFNKILIMNSDDRLNNTINNLSYISNILEKYYNKDPLYEEVNRKEKNITNTNIIGSTSGEKVVESSMIFTNYIVSKYFKDNNLPFIYRNHNIDKSYIDELNLLIKNIVNEDNNDKSLLYIEMLKNMYPKAVYDINPKGHFGLGIDSYCHITSPLRRMADVIGLICLDRLYFSEYNEETKEKISKLVLKNSKRINDKRDSIEKFSKEYEHLNKI